MATAKPKPTKSSTKPKSKGLVATRFRFNKLGALAIAVVLSIGGAVYVFTSYADSNCPSTNGGLHQCVYNTPGIGHHGGKVVDEEFYYKSSSGQTLFTDRFMWYADYSYTRGNYMWFGPYASIQVATSPPPNPVHGIIGCWYFVSSSSFAVFDITENTGKTVLWSQNRNLTQSKYIYRELNGVVVPYAQIQSFCQRVSMKAGLHSKVELRVKISPPTISGGVSAIIYLYKTSWQSY